MPLRDQPTKLRYIANWFIVDRIEYFQNNHWKTCTFCKGVVGKLSSFHKQHWENYFETLGVNVTFDCPIIVKSVDQLVSYIPTYEMKNEVSNYLSSLKSYKPASFGYAIMKLLDFCSRRGRFCSKIKHLVKKFGLLSFCPVSEKLVNELKHFLPLAPNLLVLDLKYVEPAEEILEMIGKECNFLRKLVSLQILKCSSKGLKKMLFSDSRHTVTRNICNSLIYVYTTFDQWFNLETHEKVRICMLWYLILSNCPNITMMQEDSNNAEALLAIGHCKSYVHENIKTVIYTGLTSEEALNSMYAFYPKITRLTFIYVIHLDLHIPDFENITHFQFAGHYKEIFVFLRTRGNNLQDLNFTSTAEDEGLVNLNELSSFCPNVTQLALSCKKCEFDSKLVSFKNLERLYLFGIDDPDVMWLARFLASLPNLIVILATESIGKYLTGDWINAVISYGGFPNLFMLNIEKAPVLNIDDVTKWIYNCPNLGIFYYDGDGYPQITESEWENLKTNIRNQNYLMTIKVKN